MRRYSKKGWEKRKKDREGYVEFYNKHKGVKRHCENCGRKLSGHVCEIAHVLPKTVFKSVSTHDSNVMYLCCSFIIGGEGCHDVYDSTWERAKGMKVWTIALERFKKFEDEITENNFMILKHFNDGDD